MVTSAIVGACSPKAVGPTSFEVARVVPDLGGSAPLFLNDAITVYFTAPVDSMTVSSDTFAVLDQDGHAVRGRLRVAGTWVTFEPEPPLHAELDDGSLRPDSTYRLVVSGFPNIDSVHAADGRRLAALWSRPFRTARLADGHPDLPAPLRPMYDHQRPFLVKPLDRSFSLPADDPRVQLHFSLPVLPTSATVDAFRVQVYRPRFGRRIDVRARSARVLSFPPPLDEFPGSTVELDLGSTVAVPGAEPIALENNDQVVVQLVAGAEAIRDYAGRPAQPLIQYHLWSVVPGSAITVAEWPDSTEARFDHDLAAVGFEVRAGSLQPLVRLEAGDGRLGVFRPSVDTVLVPGEPFDRGDGSYVRSDGAAFSFAAIDIPAGVRVTVAATRPVQLLARGRIRVAGEIEIRADAPLGDLRAGERVDLSTVVERAAVTMLAAGGIEISGAIAGHAESGGAPLALVSAGPVRVGGSVPADLIVATERGVDVRFAVAAGARAVGVQLTPGLPPGVEVLASGLLEVHTMPADRGGAAVRVSPADSRVGVAWQVLPVDPVRGGPDLDPARASPPRVVVDGDRIDAPPGSHLRMRVQAKVRGGEELPTLHRIQVRDR